MLSSVVLVVTAFGKHRELRTWNGSFLRWQCSSVACSAIVTGIIIHEQNMAK